MSSYRFLWTSVQSALCFGTVLWRFYSAAVAIASHAGVSGEKWQWSIRLGRRLVSSPTWQKYIALNIDFGAFLTTGEFPNVASVFWLVSGQIVWMSGRGNVLRWRPDVVGWLVRLGLIRIGAACYHVPSHRISHSSLKITRTFLKKFYHHCQS